MKAGTATKMVLNMITTTSMIRINKTYGNYMVDLKVTNEKLKIRAVNIVKQLTGLNIEKSEEILEKANNNVKAAIVMQRKNVENDRSLVLLNKMNGNLRAIIG